MRRITKSLVALAFAAGAVTTVGATSAQAQPTDGTYEGCPYGAVCIYPQNAGWNNGQPSDFFYSYGAHNLSNQYGTHVVFNNQYGGATATLTPSSSGRIVIWQHSLLLARWASDTMSRVELSTSSGRPTRSCHCSST